MFPLLQKCRARIADFDNPHAIPVTTDRRPGHRKPRADETGQRAGTSRVEQREADAKRRACESNRAASNSRNDLRLGPVRHCGGTA